MNDRFKFRIWDTKQQKYRQRTHHEADTCLNCLTGKVLFGEGIEIYGEEDDKDVIAEQCTGLKDKNGKLIYEGDIVECDEGIGKVFYSIPTASLGIEFSDYSIYGSNICHYDIDVIDCIIIGNIHENKELLDE